MLLPALLLALLSSQSSDQTMHGVVQTQSDLPAEWHAPSADRDYRAQDVMIPMRDGVRLHTLIIVPKNAKGYPILLGRTPYDAKGILSPEKPKLADAIWKPYREWVDDGYILVGQDIRGKFGSEGVYVMTRPPRGPLNPTDTDDTTDAYDTIDWLVKHLPESNGRVGMLGSSYDGWTVTMALLGPHPALKVTSPMSPMIDGWMGDDWFHNGAFRQSNFNWFAQNTSVKGKGDSIAPSGKDDYANFLEAGSAGDYARKYGIDQIPWWERLTAHPSYDALWKDQALDKIVASKPSKLPTLWLEGLWDEEDIYGAVHTWTALRKKVDSSNDHLVIGPWSHSQVNGAAEGLGPLKWNGDTAAQFRRDVLVPFFDHYLRDRKPSDALPRVMIYDASAKRWDRFDDWPSVGPDQLTPMFLQANASLGFDTAQAGEDSYVSDPAKPVPFMPLPVEMTNHPRWATWLLQDQRFVSTRPDVLSYATPPLDKPVRVEGAPMADLFLKNTGSDMDVVVKLIDVYPPSYPADPSLSGYQLPISLDILRGRYRKSVEHAEPIPSGVVQEYAFALPNVNYTFKPGHRIMVQIQSTLFPLYDRNPQTFVDNIFFAKPTDYRSATISIQRGANGASAVRLPVVPRSRKIGAAEGDDTDR